MNIKPLRNGNVSIQLTPQTADLVRRYAEVDAGGYICKYHIINEEIVGALRSAIGHFGGEMVLGERPSHHWAAQSPCATCADAKGCTITCRLKHNFEKDIYGGLLCGSKAAIVVYDTTAVPEVLTNDEYAEWADKVADGEQTNELFFRVRLTDNNELEVALSVPHKEGAVWHTKFHPLVIDHREISLRPWSMALYRTFLNRPEGVTLASLCGDNKRDLLRHYLRASDSELKTAKLKEALQPTPTAQHLLNNKLSDLNNELREQGVSEIFMVRSEQYKSNNQPYFIRYIKEQKSGQ